MHACAASHHAGATHVAQTLWLRLESVLWCGLQCFIARTKCSTLMAIDWCDLGKIKTLIFSYWHSSECKYQISMSLQCIEFHKKLLNEFWLGLGQHFE